MLPCATTGAGWPIMRRWERDARRVNNTSALGRGQAPDIPFVIFLAEAAKFLILRHLLTLDITRSAQNIGNARFAGKIFRNKELAVLRCLPCSSSPCRDSPPPVTARSLLIPLHTIPL